MDTSNWTIGLHAIYDKAVKLYSGGQQDLDKYFDAEETAFLAAIGLQPINVYDYVEDFVDGGDPDWDTFLLTAAARRDFFIYEQKGAPATRILESSELPARDSELGGFRWLPRIIAKGRCFLEGGLCHDIMYGCGGDRGFLRRNKIHSADFLRAVWASHGDDQKILAFVREASAQS